MPKITFLPHHALCPQGKVIDAAPGVSLLDAALENGLEIEHACEKACACTTCHVIVRQGFDSLEASSEKEEDMLDRAWGLEPESRLACQAKLGNMDVVIEIPKYTLNLAREQH